MVLLSLSASHRDLDLDVLEQLSSGAHSVGTSVVADSPAITGCVVLATCNRFELYLDTDIPRPADDGAPVTLRAVEPLTAGRPGDPAAEPAADGTGPSAVIPAPPAVGAARPAPEAESLADRAHRAAIADAARDVMTVVARTSGLDPDAVAESLQLAVGPAVSRHLFAVASGLDSMVVGEREVAGQVRRALQTARALGTTSSTLERLFQSASRTSRAVGSRTGLGGTGRSVVGVALDLVAQDVDLRRSSVLLIGTGSYAGASLTALRTRGVHDVAVYSPSGRAHGFATDRGARAVEVGGLPAALAEADVVVSCSGALGPVVDVPLVKAAREAHVREGTSGAQPREGGAHAAEAPARPRVLVDLALAHDVDPAVATVPGVRLVDLATIQANAPAAVSREVVRGRRIVDEHAAEFEATLAEQTLVPAVVALRRHVEQAMAAELHRVRAGDPETAAAVERSLRRFAASVLHVPAVRAREHARLGRHEEYRDGLEALFGLQVAGGVGPRASDGAADVAESPAGDEPAAS
ncbi:glutamyl-tRNA reductase [Actinotalea sp. Marseille-Q4924]|uniref:glutamyl-tRNA reductase n=1 Tax=Actinotalea sp. Marseille-Q4924 TaxID=2866571 RepID=UPI001CE3E4D7|nr:glutamyl-tRNA reductase [Actinotalea sp. Marseille-Q4924]